MSLWLFFAFLLIFACTTQTWGQALDAANSTVLAGSDLLKGAAAESLKKATANIPGGVEFAFDGSLHGERRLREGSVDAALLIIPEKEKVPEILSKEWIAHPVAYQTVVVIVNEANKLDSIDLPSLAAIYGKEQEEIYRNWSQLKGSGLDSIIFAISTHYDLGIVAPLFRNKVMKDAEFQEEVAFRPSDAIAEEHILAHPNAIGILATRPMSRRARILALRPSGKNTAYLPTPENLHNGDYPLAVPVYFVFAKKKAQKAVALLPVVLGNEFAKVLPTAGLIPVPENLRANIIRDASTQNTSAAPVEARH